MSGGLFGIVDRFLAAAGAAFDAMHGYDFDDDDGADDGAPIVAQPVVHQQPPIPVVQQPPIPVVQQPPVQVVQPVVAGPTLAQRLQTERTSIAAVRTTLGNPIWQLGDETTMDDLASSVDSWVIRQRAVPLVANDPQADQVLLQLQALTASIAAIAGRHVVRIKAVHKLYLDHGALPGVPAAATIWTPLLGTSPPNENTLLANLTAIERAFAAALPTGFDDLDATEKAQRFVDMWKLRAVGPNPSHGVGDIYVSSFDGPRDRFGVSWNLTGLDGWVLHGHAQLQWDDDEQNVTEFLIPRLHIKPEAEAEGQGGTIEIADNTVIDNLRGRSLAHVRKLAKNHRYAEVFARTKFKRRG